MLVVFFVFVVIAVPLCGYLAESENATRFFEKYSAFSFAFSVLVSSFLTLEEFFTVLFWGLFSAKLLYYLWAKP